MADELIIEVLPDGRCKCTTPEIGMANHQTAEGIFRTIAQLTGGPTTRKARTDVKKTTHKHHHSQKS